MRPDFRTTCAALAALLLLLTPRGGASPSVTALAETDLGPVPSERLLNHVHLGIGLPGDSFGEPATHRWVEQIAKRCALEQIALHELERRGLGDDLALQARLETLRETHHLNRAEPRLIGSPSPLSSEAVGLFLEENRERYRLPSLIWWRFMHFTDAEESSAEIADPAREAEQALAAGEEFAAVAERLASPPAGRAPGALIGPMALEGSGLMPTLERTLRTIPPGEPSGLVETPVGPVIALVVSREIDRWPEEENLLALARADLAARRAQEHRARALAQMRARHPVEIPEGVTSDMPGETIALRVGETTVTLDDLVRRAQLQPDPVAALEEILAPRGRAALADRLVILAERDRLGLEDDPEDARYLEWNLEQHAVEYALHILREEMTPSPRTDELSSFFESHRDEFQRDLLSVEALWLSLETLVERASSEHGLHLLQTAETVRQAWSDGEEAAALLGGGQLRTDRTDSFTTWTDIPEALLPDHLRSGIRSLGVGEISPVQLTGSGILLVRLSGLRTGTPSLEQIRREVAAAWRRENAPEGRFGDRLLEEHGYRLLVEPSRLRWDESGEGIVLIPRPE